MPYTPVSLPPLEQKRRWYYDACALDKNKNVPQEIINLAHQGKVAVTSHLAIGEAFSNVLQKSLEKENPSILTEFVELLKGLREGSYLFVKGHDSVKEEYDLLRELSCIKSNQRIHLADMMHLATAIGFQCDQIRTSDPDLIGISGKELREFAKTRSCHDFLCREI